MLVEHELFLKRKALVPLMYEHLYTTKLAHNTDALSFSKSSIKEVNKGMCWVNTEESLNIVSPQNCCPMNTEGKAQ